MAAATATSKVSPVVTGSGEEKSTSYISTKVTGPDNNGAYSSEIIQYDNAQGEGGKTIGTRDPNTGVVTLNDNASADIKANKSSFKKASDNQIESIQDDLATSASEKEKLNRVSGRGNRDNTDGNTDSSTSKATPRNESGDFTGMSITTGNPRNSYEKELCYPVAMRSNLKDSVQINIIKHQPKSFEGLKTVAKPKGPTIGSVILPMPSAIADGNKTEWGAGTMTPAQMAASGVVKKILGGTATDAVKQAQEAAEDFMSSDGKKAMENFFTEQLTGAEDLLARTEGMVMNPNMELLFKGPGMRSFSFSWKMSPRDKKESIVIAKIIRTFKQSMAPQKVVGALFLKAPNVYDITFRSGTQPNRFLPKIKTCGLTDCAVNYTPDGSFMAYDNDSMVALELTLSFQEMEPIYNNDMSTGYDSVGY
tara:strand:+ start:140 stop:1405 length:1266 start_codon:yes stop_codon:yes gene_type:complete